MRRLLPLVFFVLLAVGCGDDATPGGATTDVGADAWSADAGADAGADATVDATSDVGADTGMVLPDRPWPVTEAGPFQPAYREMEVTYTPRRETEPRTLRLAVWYPTNREPEGNEFVLYYELLRRYGIVDAGPIAPAAMADGPMPLLVFSHGNAAMAEQSFFMTEFFASHGWVVVSPDHTGNTVRDTGGAINLTSAVYRPQDISAVIDHVLALDADDPLAGQIDADKIALSGHSFGGFTTLAVTGASFAVDELMADCDAGQADGDICSIFQDNDAWLANFREGFYDDRVKIGIPQAPGGYTAFRSGIADIRVPTLLMTGQMDATTPNDEDGDPIWEHLDGEDDLRVDFMTAGHFTFSNMCDYFGGVEQVANDGCNSDFIDPADAYTIINAFSLAYARLHLFGDDHAVDILEGDRVVEGGYELADKP